MRLRKTTASSVFSAFTTLLLVAGINLASAPSAAAQTSAPAADTTRIILLGTMGGPIPGKFRSEPASLLVVNGQPYLIDTGPGVVRQLVWAGYQPNQVRTMFITHHHVDHNAGLVALISTSWFGTAWGGKQMGPPVQIYGPPDTQYLVGKALDFLGVSERIFRAGVPALQHSVQMFQGHDIDHDGVVYSDENVRVTAAENSHFHFPSSSPEAGLDRPYAYRFDTPHGSVVFTGDTGPSSAVVQLAMNADVLVSEIDALNEPASARAVTDTPPEDLGAAKAYHQYHEHLSPQEVGEMAAQAHVKAVLLTHFVPGGEVNDVSRFTAGVKQYFHGPVIAGRDLFEYDVYGSQSQATR